MNLNSLEGSIQNLLSVLYPPFEATAPTLLSQLFQIIDSRYQGDALRCLLDFLVPAKHILDSVQQAACAQYSNVLFLCEGWPLCLRDQVVIHLAPINPLLLQPGDFYLQVTPFCDQSARIVVCSLLEEEGLRVEVVEETPIPETSYPCIFSCEWLKEINQGRHGTPLGHCLVATEHGVVRLPWERVAVPDFVGVQKFAGSSMASIPPSYPPLPPPLSLSPPLPHFSKNSSSNHSFPLAPAKQSAPKQCNVNIQNSILTSSSHPTAFSVETRICPAKHGIAVSVCLVDTSAASSSRLVKVKESETEPKPIGWVSPNTWDSRFTGTDSGTATKTSTVSSTCAPASTNSCSSTDKIQIVSENTGQVKHKVTNLQDTSRCVPAGQVAAEGEYIDILQATMLFAKAQSVTDEQKKLDVQKQPHTQIKAQMQRHPQIQAQIQPHVQIESYRQIKRQPNTQIPPQAQSQANVQLPTKPQIHSPPRSEAPVSLMPNMSTEAGPPSALHHSQAHATDPDSPEPSQCVRTVWFSEKPCTPCMTRRQGGKVSRAQELRCRYRDSYQAAIQNPVTFGQEKERGNVLAVLEEDGDFSDCDDRQRPPGTDTGDPWCNVQAMWCDPGVQKQSPFSVSGTICKESGEKNTVPYWKPGDSNTVPYMEYRDANPLKYGGLPEQAPEKITVPFREPGDAHSAKPYNNLHSLNRKNSAAETRINTNKDVSSSNDPKQSDVITAKHHGLLFSLSEISGMSMTLKPCERLQNKTTGMSPNKSLPQSRKESMSDGRCSSLSTAVVDTSEKCELVIVEGQNVRRRENTESCAEIPQLHVVKCKNSTAFRLVSPKINRRTVVIPDGAQHGRTSITSRNGHQRENLLHTDPPPAADMQRISQPASARPRPNHLPLGSPDPRAHPLYLGVASLTGGRDRTNRAIVELYGDHQGWRSAVTSQELFQMLLYFHSITRREIRETGMTLISDARKTNPQPQLYKALMTLQEQSPQAVHSLVLLVDKDSSLQPERCPGVQTDIVTSMKALLKLVEGSQLSSRLDGTLSHSHCDWMELHQKLFPFVSDLHEASSLLLRAITKLEEPQRTDTVQTLQQCMMDQRTLMREVLEDSRLVSLQREGGAVLARLRKESDLKYPHCEDLSDAVDSVTSLYNHVEEQAHVLVQRSNLSLMHLEYLLQLREMEGHFSQMQQWFNVEGEHHLLEAESVEDSGDRMEQILNSFTGFLIEANDRRHHAMSLVSEAERLQQNGLSYPETETFRTFVCTFKSGLEDFLCRAESCGRDLQIMVNVCDFCEQAVALANECTDYLDQSQSNIQSIQHQNRESGLSTTSLCQSELPAVFGSGSTTTGVSLIGSDSSILQTFQDRFLQFNPEKFQEVKAQASALRGSRGMRVWNIAWLRCQEARQQLQERMQDVDGVHHQKSDSSSWFDRHYVDVMSTNIQTASPGGQSLVVQSTPGPRHPQWEGIMSGAVDLGKRRPILGSNSTNSTNVACSNIIIKPEDHNDAGTSQGSKVTPQSPQRSARRTEKETRRRQASRARSERDAAALSQSHTVGCQWFPWGRGLRARSVSQDSCATGVATAGSSTPPEQRFRPSSSCSHHGQPSCRILKEAQKFQISRHGSFCSEDSCMSDRGAAGGNGTLCCKHSSLSIGRYEGAFCLANPQESGSNALRLQRVLEELVFTEREYVRSLGYILNHYLPLLDRPDIPQDLRGKRGVIFGNLEKLFDFHSHYFLPELEACQREPAMVARCFLRHSESFGLYALYSKNKPQSDALILHHRHDIFKKKQQELGDMMDLSSYLLRPIQRISKYSLLLQDMLALAGSYRPKDMIQDTLLATSVCTQSACDPGAHVPDLTSSERERERAEIQAAADLVRFQMRHGNDLLTMDAIQDCDVNLKEQGQLIRQDEFTVFFRKKKCVRRIFLFEDLILFSKTKRTDVGNDVYLYKQSFKTSDIGMTHNSGVSGQCFEIWFRRRKSEDTYTLKASSMDVKKAWTADLERILWDQAAHSRELRMQERVFMGMSCKPFMDIQPSDAAICDRAVSGVLPGRIPVACCSHRGLDYPRPRSIGSGSTASTTLSQSSSSSGRGSLPPAGYPGNHSQGVESSPAICSSPEAVDDNELNNHHLHQHRLHRNCEQWKTHPHPLTDSTESSGECINFFSSSDHSCLSAIGGEVVDSSSSFISQSSKLLPPLCQTPSQRRNSLPVIIKKKPGTSPRPLCLTNAPPQSDEIIIAKSTEV
ncbi:pleckstrin homology domain-containing family G member 4B-like [Trachinotus anak]|uniref:pleckstrin homology domain-containing family G member 4B-like n=1 Tax=Trachinotus anak TaxID=443729 RepID=UPI0039F1911F